MSEMGQAVARGFRHGVEMAIDPQSTRLRQLAELAASTDYTAEAWEMTGESLRLAMREADGFIQESRASN